MSETLIAGLVIFVLATFLGAALIGRVPPTLHTPLMSGANAISGITVVGAITLASGVLIVVGAVAMTKFQRLYEAAISRTLGASTRILTAMVALEYALLGLLAGLLGAAGALGLSWALARYLFDMTWRPAPGLLAGGAALTGVIVCVVGLAASLDVLLRKPLGTLRSD